MSVRLALLGLLAQQPRHGYELHSAFMALVGGPENWDLKPAQVYTTLSRLEEAGLVEAGSPEKVGGPEKVTYHLTPEGQAEVNGWLTSPEVGEYTRDTFYLKLMLGIANADIDVYDLLHVQRAGLYQELHRVTDQRQNADPEKELGRILQLDKTVMHLEADLRWLDMVETRLDEIEHQPLPKPEVRPRGRPRQEE